MIALELISAVIPSLYDICHMSDRWGWLLRRDLSSAAYDVPEVAFGHLSDQDQQKGISHVHANLVEVPLKLWRLSTDRRRIAESCIVESPSTKALSEFARSEPYSLEYQYGAFDLSNGHRKPARLFIFLDLKCKSRKEGPGSK